MRNATRSADPRRRRLLQLGVLGASAAPLANAMASLGGQTSQGTQAYTGPGYYLYPSWGNPALYHVSEVPGPQGAGTTLAFRAAASGRLLWTQSLAGEACFAGRLVP